MIPLVDLKSQYQSIKDEIDSAIAEVVESCHFILGAQVEAFEADLAAYCETRFACGVNSGTSALHLALLAAEVGPGDAVGLSCWRDAAGSASSATAPHAVEMSSSATTANAPPSPPTCFSLVRTPHATAPSALQREGVEPV